ncbi:head-tail connector protein [Leuconostoc lactis]|uniref:head-tail connector protein n=1 Tax=Leuconostoc lactis TaxID=1246 RepID=UPI00351E88CC
MAVDATKLADSLNLDPEEVTTLQALIDQSKELVKSSVNYSMTDEQLETVPLFDSAVSALATALYYDRTLENGMPRSARIMITHLQGRLGGF